MKQKYRKFFKNAMRGGVVDAAKVEIRGKVIAGKLNLREKPSLQSKVVGQVRRNNLLFIINKLDEWYQITHKNKTAFVYSKYIQIMRTEILGVITASALNVRSQPNTAGKVLGKIRKNQEVKILKQLNDWHQIEFNGAVGFVSNKYVKILSAKEAEKKKDTPKKGGDYFYQREDLAKVALAPKKQIPVPSRMGKEKTAATTWNNYGGLIKTISDELEIEVESALAVLCVESGGNGFKNGRMTIRFENHIFYMYWGKKNEEKYNTFFDYNRDKRREEHKYRSTPEGEWVKGHTSQDVEWETFEFARTVSEREAIYSISMGAPQIMGFNYKSIGYASPQEMFKYFNKDIRYHLLALFDFCKYKPERITYLQEKDFYKFSEQYNGKTAPGKYEIRIKEYYDIFKNIL